MAFWTEILSLADGSAKWLGKHTILIREGEAVAIPKCLDRFGDLLVEYKKHKNLRKERILGNQSIRTLLGDVRKLRDIIVVLGKKKPM